jgi:hypothetical protein
MVLYKYGGLEPDFDEGLCRYSHLCLLSSFPGRCAWFDFGLTASTLPDCSSIAAEPGVRSIRSVLRYEPRKEIYTQFLQWYPLDSISRLSVRWLTEQQRRILAGNL